jgi:hypothetical protein
VFVLGKSFQPCLCRWVRTLAYTRVEHLKGASFRLALALLGNIRQGWKGLPGTDTVAYYENSYITDIKRFVSLGPGVNVIKTFFFVTDLKGAPLGLDQTLLRNIELGHTL